MMQTAFSLSVFTTDPLLDRLDFTAPFDQALVEMLVFGLQEEDLAQFQDSKGNFFDVCEWSRVTCTEDRVTAIILNELNFKDSQFPFSYIPLGVKDFNIEHCSVFGTLDPSFLPANIAEFTASQNVLHGSLKMNQFPREMQRIQINGNQFEGSLVFSDLPSTLRFFVVNANIFTGAVDFDDLPALMDTVDVSWNKLSGKVKITELPTSLRILRVGGNQFSGDFLMLDFPPGLLEVSIISNKFISGIVLKEAVGPLFFAFESGDISKVVDDKGNPHRWENDIVDISIDNESKSRATFENQSKVESMVTTKDSDVEVDDSPKDTHMGISEVENLDVEILEKRVKETIEISEPLEESLKSNVEADEIIVEEVSSSGLSEFDRLKIFYTNLSWIDEEILSKAEETGDFCTAGLIICDDDGVAESFDAPDWELEGTLLLSYLPKTLKWISIVGEVAETSPLYGTIDTKSLPRNLEGLQVYSSSLSGPIALDTLPPSMTRILIEYGMLSGSCMFDSLPRCLEELSLADNMLSGTINLQNLPESLESLKLSSNSFSGSARCIFPPKSLKDLDISYNSLTSFYFEDAVYEKRERRRKKSSKCHVNVESNEICDDVIIKGGMSTHFDFKHNWLGRVIDGYGNAYSGNFDMGSQEKESQQKIAAGRNGSLQIPGKETAQTLVEKTIETVIDIDDDEPATISKGAHIEIDLIDDDVQIIESSRDPDVEIVDSPQVSAKKVAVNTDDCELVMAVSPKSSKPASSRTELLVTNVPPVRLSVDQKMEIFYKSLHCEGQKNDSIIRGRFLSGGPTESSSYQTRFQFECKESLGGTLIPDYLPRTLSAFSLCEDSVAHPSLVGGVNTRELPGALSKFSLCNTSMTGPVALNALPSSLQTFIIERNKFSGNCVLGSLPIGLIELSLAENSFTGSLDLQNLPKTLRRLKLNNNSFCGGFACNFPPDGLELLDVSNNSLSRFSYKDGSYQRQTSIKRVLKAQSNSLSGDAIIEGGTSTQFYLESNAISRVIDGKGNELKLKYQLDNAA